MHLLHFNMAAVSICCLLLLGGFSYRQSKPGVWAMLAGALGLLVLILLNMLPVFLSLRGGRFQPRNGSRPAIAA